MFGASQKSLTKLFRVVEGGVAFQDVGILLPNVTQEVSVGDEQANFTLFQPSVPQESRSLQILVKCTKKAQQKNYKHVIREFDNYLQPTKVTKLYMKKFENRKQQPGETVSQYISALREIAQNCEYGDTLEQQLCKQISVGVSDRALRDRLWSEDLTLKQITEKCHHHEQKLESLKEIEGSTSTVTDVNYVRRDQSRGRSRHRSQGSRNQQRRDTQETYRGATIRRPPQRNCTRCGKLPHHSQQRCPALEKTCNYCKLRGHFAVMCRNKNRNVHFVNTCDDYFQDVNDYDDCYEMCNVEESMNFLNIYSIGVNKPTEYWSVILSTTYEQGN
ncbi:uncharacterized protein LOC143248136 [Tachypleus tridentatus]|uniref:uncharacterized protein LOC143248136 n=1 Tax=Tachypleus tridentatus TaxID=6853 RepID=UPI003FD266F7